MRLYIPGIRSRQPGLCRQNTPIIYVSLKSKNVHMSRPYFLMPSSGVARNFERGFPNDRAGGLGGAAPQKKRGVRGCSPPENF